MVARRFFYACGGLLALAIAFQLGASVARSQGASTITTCDLEMLGSFIVDSQNNVYYGLYPTSGVGARWVRQGTIPSAAPVVSVAGETDTWVHACASNGDFFVSPDLGRTWQRAANVFTGPTSDAVRQTLGQLKLQYRR